MLQTLNTMRMIDPQTMEETRKAMRFYEELLVAQLQGEADMEFPSNLPFAKQRYHVCVDQAIYELCALVPEKTERLSMLCSQRLSFSETLARLKFADKPFDFLRRSNLLWQLVRALTWNEQG
jgi:hypothetical protein